MPELPEVTTIVRELNRAVRGKKISDVEIRAPKLVRPLTVAQFRSAVRGKTFLRFSRRAKFILAALGPRRLVSRAPASYQLQATSFLLWHMGMTGHPLFRDPAAEAQNPKLREAMADPMNQHVRLVFRFADGTRLEYADIRKFGKAELVPGKDLPHHRQLSQLGPDALDLAGRPEDLCGRLRAEKRSLKVVLLDQQVIAGIGNIYADEILWTARLHPLLPAHRLRPDRCTELAHAVRSVLRLAIRAQGSSVDDFRRVRGGKGRYGDILKTYRRTGLPCPRCGALIRRLVVGGRGTHICPHCQRKT